MYASSLHGTIYATNKNTTRAPTCVSCHMYKGTHNVTFGIVYDSWGNAVDRNGSPYRRKNGRDSKEMIKGVCFQCHIKSLTLERFELADQVKQRAKGILDEAEKVILGLNKKGFSRRTLLLQEPALSRNFSHRGHLLSDVPVPECLYLEGSVPFQRGFCSLVWWAHLQLSLIEIKEEAGS